MTFWIDGRQKPSDPRSPAGAAQYRHVTDHYFKASEIPLLRGRLFGEGDSVNSPKVVLINQLMAQRFWSKENPIGRRITVGDEKAPREIVGIVGDVREIGLAAQAPPELFIPYAQVPHDLMTFLLQALPASYVIRTNNDPLRLARSVRETVQSVNAQQPVSEMRTMDQILKESVARRRFSMILLGLFGGAALILAAIGIYAVMSYTVVQQTREIGIRVALHGSRRDVLRLVIGQALALAVSGVVTGLACVRLV